MIFELYGIGGYCENCDETHDHPLNNIIDIQEVEDQISASLSVDTLALAEALSSLPVETLESIKQALGI